MMDTHIQESKGIFTADQFLREFREKQHRETVCKVHGKHLCAECFPLEKKAEVWK